MHSDTRAGSNIGSHNSVLTGVLKHNEQKNKELRF